MNYLCSLTRSLRLSIVCLSHVSQFSLGSSLYCGFLIHRGVLLFRRGAPLIHRGALLLCLLRTGGLLPCLLRRGGLLRCLLRTGGLLLCLLHRGGLLPCPLRTGGLLLCLLRRGGQLSGSGGLLSRSGGLLLRRGGLLPCLLRTGGLLLCLLCRGGLLPCLLRTGGLLSRPLCLNPQSLHFHMDLALRPSPVPPPLHRPPGLYWSVWKPLLVGGALSRIRSVAFRPIATRGRLSIILTLTPHS